MFVIVKAFDINKLVYNAPPLYIAELSVKFVFDMDVALPYIAPPFPKCAVLFITIDAFIYATLLFS